MPRASLPAMAKSYHCPVCQNEVERAASICSNVACRRDLAYCSHCRDVTTYTLVTAAEGRLSRDSFRCDRCEHLGARCLTWAAGGYCNGLATSGERMSSPLCANCSARAYEMGRSMAGFGLMTALGVLFKKRK